MDFYDVFSSLTMFFLYQFNFGCLLLFTFSLFNNSPHINNNIIMFEAAGLSIREVFTIVQVSCLHYHHSDESRHALLNLIKSLDGPKFKYINT